MSLVKEIDTLVVGAGQAGIAMSEHLSDQGIEHLVLEKDRVAERWRSWRWDSLVANGPAWHDRFPGLNFDVDDQDIFVPKEQVADYFVDYATKIKAPIQTGIEVLKVTANKNQAGFVVETSLGTINAKRVIAATGPFQVPSIPPVVPQDVGVKQLHSSDYLNPQQLEEGAVLVVGAGSSGVQIADELRQSGRKVYLSVSKHDRPPRVYRGRDYDWWLGVLGLWDSEVTPGVEHVSLAVSGAEGGKTIDFRRLAQEGMTLVGRVKSYHSGKIQFENDLKENLKCGDDNYLSLIRQADAYVDRYGIDLPEEPEAYDFLEDPDCVKTPILDVNLQESGITTIIWATGFGLDFSWINIDTFDNKGQPEHRRGVSKEPGLYFLGLPWLSCRGSSFIWGVWHDAKFIADHINKEKRYLGYHDQALGS